MPTITNTSIGMTTDTRSMASDMPSRCITIKMKAMKCPACSESGPYHNHRFRPGKHWVEINYDEFESMTGQPYGGEYYTDAEASFYSVFGSDYVCAWVEFNPNYSQ